MSNNDKFLLYKDWFPLIKSLPDDNRLKLYDMIFEYEGVPIVEIDDPHLKGVYDFIINRINDNNQKYNERCRKARESANQRWHPDACEPMPSDANACESKKRIDSHYNPIPIPIPIPNPIPIPKPKEDKNGGKPPKPPKVEYTDNFIKFWDVYPRRISKKDANKAFERAIKIIDFDKLIDITKQFAIVVKDNEKKYIPYPATWLNRDGWEDDIESYKEQNGINSNSSKQTHGKGFQAVGADHLSGDDLDLAGMRNND